MKRASLPLLLTILLTVSIQAQKLDNPTTLTQEQMRVEVAEFESPDQSDLGYVIARMIARDIYNEYPRLGGVHVSVPPTMDQRVSHNPEYLETIAQQNHASIVVWGEYYFEGDTVIIRPYLRITPQTPMTDQSFGLRLTTAEGDIVALPPSMQINITPMFTSRKRLEEIQAGLAATRTLREEPDGKARAVKPSPAIAAEPKPTMWIVEIRGAWMKVRLHDNTTGWIEAPSTATPFGTARMATFIKGAALYITGQYPAAEQALAAHLSQYSDDDNAMNKALVHTLLGTTRVRMAQGALPLPASENVSQEYLAAKNLIPDSPSPRDHLAVTRMLKHQPDANGMYAAPVGEFADTEDDLIESVKKDKNDQSLNNLKVFYRLAARQKFLKESGDDDASYQSGIQERIGIVSKVEEEERQLREGGPIVMLRIERQSFNMMSLSGGLWLPKDAEKGITFANTSYEKANALISQSQAFGGELHYRNGVAFPLSFDFAMSVWYSSYDMTPSATADTVRSATAWVLLTPAQFGFSFTLLSGGLIEPYINAGAGVTFAMSDLNIKARASEINEDEKTDIHFSWYLGGGADLFLGKDFAIGISAKYQFLKLKEPMWTGQTDFTGLQIFAGFTFKL
jgi:hypothetical protein